MSKLGSAALSLTASVLTCLALLLSAQIARADPATEASFYFERASAHSRKGDYAAALEDYFVSNGLSRNASVIFNIARCFELLRRHDEAFTYISEYLAEELTPQERAEGETAMARVLPRVARLSVVTEPPGATLYIDRLNLGAKGVTPRLLAYPAGSIEVIVHKEGRHAARSKVKLARGEEIAVRLSLPRIEGVVELTTQPPGAEVRVGSEIAPPAGTTPAALRLAPGEHELFVTREGHLPARRRIAVHADRSVELALALEALPPPLGSITITANRPGAVVTVDGRPAGFTPTILDDVALGRRTLAVTQKGYRPWTGEVDVTEGAPVWANVSLAATVQDEGRGPWPWIVSASAAATLAVGGVFGMLARQSEQEYDDDPSTQTREDGRFRALAADALLGTGLLMAGASVALFVLTQPDEERESEAFFSGGATHGATP